jgi:ABC-type lipoprotein release transport system permease subunit
MKTKNTLDTSANSLTLRQDFSPDIVMFLNSASEPEIRHLIALYRREKETEASFDAPVSKDREEQDALDNLNETDKNSTQIRGTGQLTEKQRNAQAALKRIKPSNPRKVDPNFNSTQVLREIRDNE